MKNLRNLLALLILTVAFYSCDSTVSIDNPETETIEEINTLTSEESNEGDERGSGD